MKGAKINKNIIEGPDACMEPERVYKIGEVAELLKLKTYVLRYWETEFPQLAPIRTESRQRLYTQADVQVLRRIQQLLHEQGMTIEGARRVLRDEKPESQPALAGAPLDDAAALAATLRKELTAIYNLLEKGGES